MIAKALCKLCGESREMCQSHIISEFLYRPLYDEIHRFNIVGSDFRNDRLVQKGLSERLLCRECEEKFSRYENYAAKLMSGQLGHKFVQKENKIIVAGIDYRLFKLFLLSILWRASVSTIDFFKLVELGTRGPVLKKMLQIEEPGEPENFACMVAYLHDHNQSMDDTFFNPEPLRWAGRRFIKLNFGGAWWTYYCDSQPLPRHLMKWIFREDGVLIGMFGDLRVVKEQLPSAKRLAKQWLM